MEKQKSQFEKPVGELSQVEIKARHCKNDGFLINFTYELQPGFPAMQNFNLRNEGFNLTQPCI